MSFEEYQKLILSELKRLSVNQKSTDEKMNTMHVDIASKIAALQVKAGIWGLIGGLIPVLIGTIFLFLKK